MLKICRTRVTSHTNAAKHSQSSNLSPIDRCRIHNREQPAAYVNALDTITIARNASPPYGGTYVGLRNARLADRNWDTSTEALKTAASCSNSARVRW